MFCLYSAVLRGVTGDHQVVNEDSRMCPAEITHLNCMGDGESGLSACAFPSGEDKSLQLNMHFHESGHKINSKEKNILWSCQCSCLPEKWKDRSTSEIQRKLETRFYLRLYT